MSFIVEETFFGELVARSQQSRNVPSSDSDLNALPTNFYDHYYHEGLTSTLYPVRVCYNFYL